MYQLFNQYRTKEVGIVQIGARSYHLQYHYPNGGSNYVVYGQATHTASFVLLNGDSVPDLQLSEIIEG